MYYFHQTVIHSTVKKKFPIKPTGKVYRYQDCMFEFQNRIDGFKLKINLLFVKARYLGIF